MGLNMKKIHKKYNHNVSNKIRHLVREAINDSNVDPTLTIDNLYKFNDLIGQAATFAEQFDNQAWNDLADALIDAVTEMSEYQVLERMIEPSGM